MRIRELHIEGFGRFSGVHLGPFEHSVTVFHGLNEAGKSTLLEFIRRVLFGFRAGRGRPPTGHNYYTPLSGGRHGGNVTVVSDEGELVTVQRMAGPGTAILTKATGEVIPELELQRLLGNHSKSVFESVFAFTIDELHDEALLADESVNSQIYSAGIGATKLPGALKALNEKKAGLFRKGGSRHEIHKVWDKLSEVESVLSEVSNNSVNYGTLSHRFKELERELSSLRECQKRAKSKLREHRNLERAWDDWNNLISAKRRLEELPEIGKFPEDGTGRLDTLEELASKDQEEEVKASLRVEEARGKIGPGIENEAILEKSEAIRQAERGRDQFDQSVRDLPGLKTKLATEQENLENTLSDLGEGWDEERLRGFDLSIIVREEVSKYGERLRTALEKVTNTRSALALVRTQLKDASGDLDRAQKSLSEVSKPDLDERGIREYRRAIRRARNTLDEFNLAERRGMDLGDQLNWVVEPGSRFSQRDRDKIVPVIVGVIGVALAVGSAFLGEKALIPGSLAGAVLLAIAGYIFVKSGPTQQVAESPMIGRIRCQIKETEKLRTSLGTSLGEEAANLGIPMIDKDLLVEVEESVDEKRVRLDKWDGMQETVTEARGYEWRLTKRRDDLVRDMEQADKKLDSVQGDWEKWLKKRGLRGTFSPDSIEELRRLVDLGRDRRLAVAETKERIGLVKGDIQDYVEVVRPLATAHGFELDPDDYTDVSVIADKLAELHESVLKQSHARTKAKNDLRETQKELCRRKRGYRSAMCEVGKLVKLGRAKDTEDFRWRARMYEERRKNRILVDDALRKLQGINGPDAALEALQAQLARSSIQTIQDDILATESKLEEIDQRIEEVADERGSVKNALDEMLSEEDSSKYRANRDLFLERMRDHAREWTVLTIAENLLREAQSRFEKERQPDVIRHASKFFYEITDKRYTAIFSPLGRSEINVTDLKGTPKKPSQLSRGTREQLFLSLRFGLALDMGQRSERLPVIVDEALVNFDPVRGLKAAEAFVELAQTNQVLVFTCHPQIVDLFDKAASARGAQRPEVVDIDQV